MSKFNCKCWYKNSCRQSTVNTKLNYLFIFFTKRPTLEDYRFTSPGSPLYVQIILLLTGTSETLTCDDLDFITFLYILYINLFHNFLIVFVFFILHICTNFTNDFIIGVFFSSILC